MMLVMRSVVEILPFLTAQDNAFQHHVKEFSSDLLVSLRAEEIIERIEEKRNLKNAVS